MSIFLHPPTWSKRDASPSVIRSVLSSISRATASAPSRAPPLWLTPANMLDRLLDPAVRLATSTPGADPGGDYAFAVFARAEAIRAGARAALEAKAQQLYGGGAKDAFAGPRQGARSRVFFWQTEPT